MSLDLKDLESYFEIEHKNKIFVPDYVLMGKNFASSMTIQKKTKLINLFLISPNIFLIMYTMLTA